MTRRKRKLPLADDTRGRGVQPSKSGCRCTNHLGGAKQQHKSQAAAVAYAASHTKYTGVTRIYRCPTSDRWHVTTRRKDDPR